MCPDFDILTASCTWHTHWIPLTQYWDDDVTRWGLNFKILRKKFHERIPYLKVPFTFNFHLSINIGTWNHNLDFFELFLGWWPRGVTSLTKFWDSGFKNEYFISNFPLYWLSCFYHYWYKKYRFVYFFTQFWVNDVTTGNKIAIFWESDLTNKFLFSTFHRILILIFLLPSIHDIQVWAHYT